MATKSPLQSLPLHALGLSIAASYAFLGASAVFLPETDLELFGIKPKSSTAEADAGSYCPSISSRNHTKRKCVLTHLLCLPALKDSMLLLGVRDWSLGAAVFWFWLRGEARNMGIVILSGLILSAADVGLVFARRGADAVAWGLGIGATIWGVIGWGLYVD